ncbi:DUF6708 domain-containing protein [Paraburkholderia tropica]|uniref:DUF6708 domain-containing protein n=1 Tax=Paraburkholderia tropica TaxID=92647 RepID=UPI002AB02FA5|nr:DUF6708 domain-containing protein [Paraburkholderia tropica]
MFGRVDALRVNDPPLGVEPGADNNVMKVTHDCLFMRTGRGSLYGGRSSMSWWAVVSSVFVWAFCSSIECGYYLRDARSDDMKNSLLEDYFSSWPITIGFATVLLLASFWIFIGWRRQLPIIFNRKTGMVACHIDKQTVSCRWENMEAYIKDVTSFAANGVATNEGVLTLIFVDDEGNRLRTGITGTRDAKEAIRHRAIYGAGMVWEYIRLYMKEGPDALPPNSILMTKYRLDSVWECITTGNPFKVFKVEKKRNLIWSVLFFPIVLPFGVILILSDLFYFALGRILPRRKWPQAMLDACNSVWDGSGD